MRFLRLCSGWKEPASPYHSTIQQNSAPNSRTWCDVYEGAVGKLLRGWMMNKESIPAVVLSDYDMLKASITVGFVYDSTHSKQYISVCLRDSLGFAMPDKDIHISVEHVPLVIDALQDQLNAFKEAQK